MYIDKSTFLVGYYSVAKQIDSEGKEFGNPFYGDEAVINANLIIQPGESMAIQIEHQWSDSDGYLETQPSPPEGGAAINYNVTFDFEQITS